MSKTRLYSSRDLALFFAEESVGHFEKFAEEYDRYYEIDTTQSVCRVDKTYVSEDELEDYKKYLWDHVNDKLGKAMVKNSVYDKMETTYRSTEQMELSKSAFVVTHAPFYLCQREPEDGEMKPIGLFSGLIGDLRRR